MIKTKIEESRQNLAVLLADSSCLGKIEMAAKWIIETMGSGKKMLICGNGGSAADAQHFAGEFIGRFYKNRRPLPAIALTTDSSILTCVSNDFSYEDVFSRQVDGIGNEGDLLFGISTSGASKNVLRAFQKAVEKKMRTILLCGQKDGDIAKLSHLIVKVPSTDTPRIQEMHLLIEHILSELVENALCEEG